VIEIIKIAAQAKENYIQEDLLVTSEEKRFHAHLIAAPIVPSHPSLATCWNDWIN